MKYFRLSVQVSGIIWVVYMSEELVVEAVEEWMEWLADLNRDAEGLMILNGVSNEVTRDPTKTVIKMEHVQGMDYYVYG